MSKYFHQDDIQFIKSEDIEKIMKRADKKPENFIRIALNGKHMRLDYKNKSEFEISEAVIFHYKENGQIIRYDFKQCDIFRNFYAVIDMDRCMAVSIDDSDNPLEDIFMFDADEAMLCIFKVEGSSIYILYDGTADSIGYSYIYEKAGYPTFYGRFLQLFDVTVPQRSRKEQNKK